MQAPVPARLLVEDFQDAPAWMPRLLTTLNRFIEQTIQVLDGNVSFGENIFARRFATSFTTSSTYTGGDFENISFSWTGSALPLAVFIAKVQHADGSQFLGSVGTPQWVYSNGSILVTYVPGLANSTKYSLTLLAI